MCALETEGLRDDGDGEGAGLAGDLRDDGGGAGAGPAAHAGGDKDHVRALDELRQLFPTLFRGKATDLRIAAHAQPTGEALADLYAHRHVAPLEGLGVGVDHDVVNAGDGRAEHAVDRVGTAAARADHLDQWRVVGSKIDVLERVLWHWGTPSCFALPAAA